MPRITLDMNFGQIITALSDGNPDAVFVLTRMLTEGPAFDVAAGPMGAVGGILRLDTLELYGSDIWLLYEDICGENLTNMLAVLRAVQLDILPASAIVEAVHAARDDRYGQAITINVPSILETVRERLADFGGFGAAA